MLTEQARPLQRSTRAISVVATVRNESSTIRAFVESILRQTLSPDEIIIVDGKSTDGTCEILAEFANAGQIQLISRDCNIAQGRNLGIRRARNDFVAITDAGCRVDESWVQNIVKCFEGPERPDVVAGNFAFDCHSDFERAVVFATFSPSRNTSPIARYYPSSRSVAFRKSAWKAAGGYPEWLYAAEDTLLNIRLRQLGYKFVFCEEAVVHWRPRESWRKLARQRFNFSRGNARVGIGTSGYLTNIVFHALALLLVLFGIRWWPSMVAGLLVLSEHVRRHLWHQAAHAKHATSSGSMLLRVLAVMEFVRIVNVFGFLAGKLDRLLNSSFKENQFAWMGTTSLDDAHGIPDVGRDRPQHAAGTGRVLPRQIAKWGAIALAVGAFGAIIASERLAPLFGAVFCVALGYTAILLVKSLYDFTQTGPPMGREILHHYRNYFVFALARLGLWVFALCAVMATFGVILYGAAALAAGAALRFWSAVAAGTVGVLLLTALQFCRHLLYLPGSIAASYHYRSSRLYPLWRLLTPRRLLGVQWGLCGTALALFAASATRLASHGEVLPAAAFALLTFVGALGAAVVAFGRAAACPAKKGTSERKNILMIGSDTLRADRIASGKNRRDVAPFIDSLARDGTLFTACYVPCARTAPSLLSLFTGTWPHRHGIRDNFVGDADTRLEMPALATLLARQGYRTAAVSDWCGGDLGKFPLGFDVVDLPSDQWNIKYLIRQGPKDLRLLLSLFTHNRFGKRFLPELYYLAGVPLTSLVGRDARALISQFATQDMPFFLNIFMSTTHPPFGSEYPYYTLWSNKDYAGESKFVMARLTDPWEIIRRQGDSKKDFDLDQIIDLYDGCVRNFDDEVKRIVEHLNACGLADNTIIVIYSDHGMEFFEHETWGQGNSVRGDFSARVPLVIRAPNIKASGPCARVVRTIDVAPTLLELAGIAPPIGMDGVSLVPYLSGQATDLNLAAFNETGIWLTDVPGMPENHLRYPGLLDLLEVPDRLSGTLAIKREYQESVIAAKDRMVRVGSWKLTYQPTTDGPLYSLYDLSVDPECRNDVSAVHPDIVRELQDRLTRWMTGAAGAT